MGRRRPAGTIAQECRRRGVKLAGVDINRSALSYRGETAQVVRVPLTAVEGVSEDAARLIRGRLAHPRWIAAQRWVMGGVLSALALRMATDARR